MRGVATTTSDTSSLPATSGSSTTASAACTAAKPQLGHGMDIIRHGEPEGSARYSASWRDITRCAGKSSMAG